MKMKEETGRAIDGPGWVDSIVLVVLLGVVHLR